MSDLHSENFHLSMEFSKNFEVAIKGFIWPNCLQEINECFSKYPEKAISEEVSHKVIEAIQSSISATSNIESLQEQFGLSTIEAKEVSKLVMKTQDFFCDHKKPCKTCKDPHLPSLMTCFIETPSHEFICNIETSSDFKIMIKLMLKQIVKSECDVTIEDWLMNVGNTCIIATGNRTIDVTLKGRKFTFFIDSRMKILLEKYINYRFYAVYQVRFI